jgi:protein-S-isoprenylcysteine O-methyltransferase Ste14
MFIRTMVFVAMIIAVAITINYAAMLASARSYIAFLGLLIIVAAVWGFFKGLRWYLTSLIDYISKREEASISVKHTEEERGRAKIN